MTEGQFMYDLAANLVDLPRSMTGEGNRETLRRLQQHVPLTMHEVPSGTKVFDWTVPDEWRPLSPVTIGKDGRGYADNILIDHNNPGSLTYGSLYLPGESSKEIFLSCYICHPFQAQDCLSGMVLAVALANWWQKQPRRHTLRVAFVPETLGALCFLDGDNEHESGYDLVSGMYPMGSIRIARRIDVMCGECVAGFVLTCCGMECGYTIQQSRNGDTLADRVAWEAVPIATRYREWKDRGSDERQYCAPGVDLPVVCIMRGAHHSSDFPQYHATSPTQGKDDTLDIISPEGLQGSYDVHVKCLEIIEANRTYQVTTIGEPELGKRNLYTKTARHLVGMCDGSTDLLSIADAIGCPMLDLVPDAKALLDVGLLQEVQ